MNVGARSSAQRFPAHRCHRFPLSTTAFSGSSSHEIRSRAFAAPRRSARGLDGALDAMIARHAADEWFPAEPVHRVVIRESRYNPRARNGGALGLMQIKDATARGMGYAGPASGLFDAETNLTYAVRYLAGAAGQQAAMRAARSRFMPAAIAAVRATEGRAADRLVRCASRPGLEHAIASGQDARRRIRDGAGSRAALARHRHWIVVKTESRIRVPSQRLITLSVAAACAGMAWRVLPAL